METDQKSYNYFYSIKHISVQAMGSLFIGILLGFIYEKDIQCYLQILNNFQNSHFMALHPFL